MKMIQVTPMPGMRILDPNTLKELKAAGEILPDDFYWHQRRSEGGVTITDPNAEQPAAQAVVMATEAKPVSTGKKL